LINAAARLGFDRAIIRRRTAYVGAGARVACGTLGSVDRTAHGANPVSTTAFFDRG
jgi:hypothetical protein